MKGKFIRKQKEFFQKLIEGQAGEEEVRKELNITQKTLLRWSEDEEFLVWMEEMAKSYARLWLPRVVEAMCRQASAGNITAQKLYFDFLGKNGSSAENILARLLEVLEENHHHGGKEGGNKEEER
ncbi:MAG: phBC6A51 family helix-turn-helix protein [bacterium JZ-2024 1]